MATQTQTTPEAAIRPSYCRDAPSAQSALDIFAGSWKSALPQKLALRAGADRMFDDQRPAWASRTLPGGVAGKSVLELGPFEAYQSYLLEQLGAGPITAVEANSINYLKCLVLKEVLGLKTRYWHGDALGFMQTCEETFDLVWASGILYHQTEPLRFLNEATKRAKALYVWTHVYDESIFENADAVQRSHFVRAGNVSKEYAGFECEHFCRSYQIPDYEGNIPMYWEGGTSDATYWLRAEDIFEFLAARGFGDIVLEGHGDLSGLPTIAFLAQRH